MANMVSLFTVVVLGDYLLTKILQTQMQTHFQQLLHKEAVQVLPQLEQFQMVQELHLYQSKLHRRLMILTQR